MGTSVYRILLPAVALLTPFHAVAGNSHDRWLGRDKLLHFSGSAVMAAGMYSGCRHGLGLGQTESAALVPVWTLTVGAAKEDHDLKIKGTGFSFRDLAVDLLGTVVGLAAVILLDPA